MFFGKFLVEQEIIDKSQLVSMICKQIQSMTPLLEVLFKNNFIDSEQFIAIVNDQIESEKSLNAVIIDNRILSIEELNKAVEIQNSQKKSLTEILISEGVASSSQMDSCIQNYSKKYTKLCEDEVHNASSVTETSDSVPINAAALESLKELGLSDEQALAELEGQVEVTNIVEITEENHKVEDSVQSTESHSINNEYYEIFDDKKLKRLLKTMAIIGKCLENGEQPSTYLSSLYRDFHILKGAATLVGFSKSLEVLSSWEEILEKLFDYENNQLVDWLKLNFSNLKSSIELLWKIRNNTDLEDAGLDESGNHLVESVLAMAKDAA